MADDPGGAILAVEVATGEADEGQVALERLDAAAAPTGAPIAIATANAGHARAKAFAGLGAREPIAVVPPKAGPIRSKAPLRRSAAMRSTTG